MTHSITSFSSKYVFYRVEIGLTNRPCARYSRVESEQRHLWDRRDRANRRTEPGSRGLCYTDASLNYNNSAAIRNQHPEFLRNADSNGDKL
jgi:hypothetical protein